MTDWNQLTLQCQHAMKIAAENPGLYGGRYVGRYVNDENSFATLEHDEPERVPDDFDVIAHVRPDIVYPIGGARYYLQPDGTVDFGD